MHVIKLKPTIMDRLKQLGGDERADRISEALPIKSIGVTPHDPCIRIQETVGKTDAELVLDRTWDEIDHAFNSGVVAINFYGDDRIYIVNNAVRKRIETPAHRETYLIFLYLDNHPDDYVEYTQIRDPRTGYSVIYRRNANV